MKIHGELGVLAEEGGRVQCHICGYFFHHLGCHVHKKHGVLAAEYKKKFGLNRRTALASPEFKVTQRGTQSARLSQYWEQGKMALEQWNKENPKVGTSARLEQKKKAKAAWDKDRKTGMRDAVLSGEHPLLSNASREKLKKILGSKEFKAECRLRVINGTIPLLRADVQEQATAARKTKEFSEKISKALKGNINRSQEYREKKRISAKAQNQPRDSMGRFKKNDHD